MNYFQKKKRLFKVSLFLFEKEEEEAQQKLDWLLNADIEMRRAIIFGHHEDISKLSHQEARDKLIV